MSEFRGARRNDPCPCGSGTKAKRCCYLPETRPTTTEDLRIEADFDAFVRSIGYSNSVRLFVARFTADAGFYVTSGERPQRLAHLHGRPWHIRLSTIWSANAKDIYQPGLLHISGVCAAQNLEEAGEFLINRADLTLQSLVVAMNAWCTPAQEYSIVEITAGLSRRPIRRSMRQRDVDDARSMRRLDDELARALTLATWSSNQADRLLYAQQHYVQAMTHFRAGAAPMCLEHLFMAVETLKPIVLERHRVSTGWTDAEYMHNWRLSRASQIEAAARLHLIFRGDEAIYSAAREASDSMEHGSTTYETLWRISHGHHEATAAYVRRAIITACDLDPQMTARLLSSRYDVPLTDLSARQSELLHIDAARAQLISGLSPQLSAGRRVATNMRRDLQRDTMDFDYQWVSEKSSLVE